jgi:hypothetical protein
MWTPGAKPMDVRGQAKTLYRRLSELAPCGECCEGEGCQPCCRMFDVMVGSAYVALRAVGGGEVAGELVRLHKEHGGEVDWIVGE